MTTIFGTLHSRQACTFLPQNVPTSTTNRAAKYETNSFTEIFLLAAEIPASLIRSDGENDITAILE